MTMATASWTDRARLELARRGVHLALINTVLTEVAEHCEDSGESPEQAFGTPAEFAEQTAATRVPLAERAKRGRDGVTVFETCSAMIGWVGLKTIVLGVFLLFVKGLFIPLTPAGLTGVPIVYAALLCALYASNLARLLGRPRTVAPAWIVTGVLVVLAATALVELPREVLGSLPTPLFLAAGGLLVWWAWQRKSTSEVAKAVEHDHEWLDRLRGLLEGRHDVPRERADALVRETAAHLAAGGNPPAEEFGPVEEYAVTLAEHQPAAPRWWQREIARHWVSFGLAVGFVGSAVFGDQPTWYFVTALALLAMSSALLVRALRKK
ncbi:MULTISPECIES: hypothetical protein [unclassified Crossiella]|uniref:hypothetical protein n=1 Tax=unclassified Crossiella TaxID=2620835 RepID=UPI001FFF64C3|nr:MULTISPECIES: hypothetical protein [unclassified Crossiella]MCK2244419.1 hypothetical protein [Crossiella sp. S99.2]MCK2257753.1 hypothetical protein [Crossiella sp. S99.1]